MSSFLLHPTIRKVRDRVVGHQKDEKEVTDTSPAARTDGVKNFVNGIISPFTACWQPDITACVPQCGDDYAGMRCPTTDRETPVVVSPLADRMNPPRYDIPTSPVTSRYSTKLALSPKHESGRKTSDDTEKPHLNDVLCGRGGSSNRHLGNMHFRELVAANKKMYTGLTKKQKMMVARKVVEAVHSTDPPGRFLAKDLDTGRWYDIGLPRSLEKTSQALREKNSNDYQSDQGTEVSDVMSETSLPYSSTSRSDSGVASPIQGPEESVAGSKEISRGTCKNLETPTLIIPQHLLHVFGPEHQRDPHHRAWPDGSYSGHYLEQSHLPAYPRTPTGGPDSSPMSRRREFYTVHPRPHRYDMSPQEGHYYHGGAPSHYRHYNGHHPATPPPPPQDYRDHYEHYPPPDCRDRTTGHQSTHRAPPPMSPGHYRSYSAQPPPQRSAVYTPGMNRSYGHPPVHQSPHYRPPAYPGPPHNHPPPGYDYSHGGYHASKTPLRGEPVAAKTPGNGYVRGKSEISPERQQEWKRQRNERGVPRRLNSETSLSRAVQNSLTLEERVVGRERANQPSSSLGGLVSPSATLQGRSRPRGEEKRALSLAAVASLTEKEGDAVTALSGLAALSTAAFLKLDESD